MASSSRKVLYSALAVVGLVAMAVTARRLAHVGLSFESLRLAMLVFTLLCPVLLGLAIGVWGGERASTWGGRGVGATYLGVVGWSWVEDGMFPVGFRLEGFQTPLLVTLINVTIFLVTAYFMHALGRSGGRFGARVVSGRPPRVGSPESRDPRATNVPSMADVQDTGRSLPI
jgi:hypothetical protein